MTMHEGNSFSSKFISFEKVRSTPTNQASCFEDAQDGALYWHLMRVEQNLHENAHCENSTVALHAHCCVELALRT